MTAVDTAAKTSMLIITVLLAIHLHGHAWFDSAHGLPEAQMIFLGFVPYKDFLLQETPFSHLVSAIGYFFNKPFQFTLVLQTILISLTPIAILWYAYNHRLRTAETAVVWLVALGFASGMLDGLFHQNTYTVYAECLTFFLFILIWRFFTTTNIRFFFVGALCWGLLLVTHQYYALYTSPLIFWVLLATSPNELSVRNRIYSATLALSPFLLLVTWLAYNNAIGSFVEAIVFSSFDSINKEASPSITAWFVSILHPIKCLITLNFKELFKSRSLVPLWLWGACIFIFVYSFKKKYTKRTLTINDHILFAFGLTLLFSLLLVSRHYGGNRILTLLSPEFVFAILIIALTKSPESLWTLKTKEYFGTIFVWLAISAFATILADIKNVAAFFDSTKWSAYYTVTGESVLIEPSKAIKFNEGIAAINTHRSCLSIERRRDVDRMIILGRGNQIYFAVNAIPYLPYIFLEDTLLGERHFNRVLSQLKQLRPNCVALFTYGRYNSELERAFKKAFLAWLADSYSIIYSKDDVYIYALSRSEGKSHGVDTILNP